MKRIVGVRASDGRNQETIQALVAGGRESELAPLFVLARTSSVQLKDALALFVKPDHQRALRVQVSIAGNATTGPIVLRGGQSGVFYQLLRDGAEVGLPGYFHQRDDQDAQLNKGIEQLRLEVDLVPVRDSATVLPGPARPAPLSPIVMAEALPLGTALQIRARKAMSGLETQLVGVVLLDPVPTIRAEPAVVNAGAAAKIVIEASVSGECYRLLRGDTVVTEAEGTGGALELDTGPLAGPAAFQIEVERGAAGPIVVSRRVNISLEVKPKG